MNDPYDPEIELRRCMDRCEVSVVANGHTAWFYGQSATFCESDGPNAWTEEMARKAAIFFWCLKQREESH